MRMGEQRPTSKSPREPLVDIGSPCEGKTPSVGRWVLDVERWTFFSEWVRSSLARCAAAVAVLVSVTASRATAQDLLTYQGDIIAPEIEAMYVKGLAYLVKTQRADGCWESPHGNEPGAVGLAVLAMLARGDDPNSGPYSEPMKKALEFILRSANRENGYIGPSMYNHGFATLALAEAYGMVNDPRIGPALKKAVGLILTSQSANSLGAWRYSPESTDADTTVSGAQMVALFAARNAGIGVPDKAIKTGLDYYSSCQTSDGGFGYTDGRGSANGPTSAIGALVFALAKRKNTSEFRASIRYLQQIGFAQSSYQYYYLYYASQALFHGDMKAWDQWNKENAKRLGASQNADGSWTGSEGPSFSTSAALLSLALNYRFLPIYER